MSIDKRGPKLGDAASLYVLLGWVDCVHTRPLLLLLLRRLFHQAMLRVFESIDEIINFIL